MSEPKYQIGDRDLKPYLTCCDICGGEALNTEMIEDWDNHLVCPQCRATGYFALSEPDWQPDDDQ